MTLESYPTSDATACPCGMPLVDRGAVLGSVRWYRQHRVRHLERFPHIDRQSRDALDLDVAWAREQEDASAISPDFRAVRDVA